MTEASKLEDVLKQTFRANSGVFYPSLEDSLQSLNVKRQAYQGGTFVGNHVHKLLKVKVIFIIADTFQSQLFT